MAYFTNFLLHISELASNKKHHNTSFMKISKEKSMKTSVISDASDQKIMKDSTNVWIYSVRI